MKNLVCRLFLLTALVAGPLFAQSTMTNADIIELAKANMSQDIMLAAVRGSTPAFDTSASGIIALNNAGVPEAVIQEILDLAAGNTGGRANSTASANGVNPEEVVLIDGNSTRQMQYLTPQIRSAARAMGFGGVAQYASLRGTSAALRTSNTPVFLVAIPNNAQAESYYTLASFAVRNNGTREVLIGGGYMSFSTGITKDRVVPAQSQVAADQSNAPENFTIYEIRPIDPLSRGEYALVLYSSQVRTMGYFSTGLDSYFDFGID